MRFPADLSGFWLALTGNLASAVLGAVAPLAAPLAVGYGGYKLAETAFDRERAKRLATPEQRAKMEAEDQKTFWHRDLTKDLKETLTYDNAKTLIKRVPDAVSGAIDYEKKNWKEQYSGAKKLSDALMHVFVLPEIEKKFITDASKDFGQAFIKGLNKANGELKSTSEKLLDALGRGFDKVKKGAEIVKTELAKPSTEPVHNIHDFFNPHRQQPKATVPSSILPNLVKAPFVSSSMEELNRSQGLADDLIRRQRQEQQQPIIIDNSKNIQGGGSGHHDSGLRLNPRNSDISKQFLDFMGDSPTPGIRAF